MSTFKCKMCGGTLEIQPGQTVAECEYCGTQQTLPKLEDDRRANLYDRANHFRRNNEFDKAMGIYEQILNEDSTDAEAYWSLVLCRYGIEYVEDPATHKRVPTVNRAQFTSVFDDDNYKSALQYADSYQRGIYEDEAKTINEIQKGILAISQKEEPFDVFICYKESDNNGRRTPDSVLANDLYHQLTQEGFKVFFARITLEDKLGSAYEPYIFAALNSAKVMVVLGTKPEYFSAVWVKNEWSRYLALIKQGQKKMLIPAYKDMDPYDLPEEFSHLQAQDMSKLGFMQDLIRGIKKITQADAPQTTVVRETVISDSTSNTAPLLKRAYMFLEDGDWASADEYCEKVLDIDPENGEAYLGKTLAQEKCRTVDAFVRKRKSVSENAKFANLHLEPNHAHIEEIAEKYAIAHYLEKDDIRKMFDYDLSYSSNVADRKAQYRVEESYWANHKLLSRAEKFAVGAVAENLTREKKALFAALSDRVKQAENAEKSEKEEMLKRYSDFLKQTDAEVEKRYRNALNIRESNYENWLKKAKEEKEPEVLRELEQCFIGLGDFRDSKSLAEYCRKHAVEEQARIDAERVQAKENARKEAERIAKRNKKNSIITATIICAVLAFILLLNTVILPTINYNKADALLTAGEYETAMEIFAEIDSFKDAHIKYTEAFISIKDAYRTEADQFMEQGNAIQAAINYTKAGEPVSAKYAYDFSSKIATAWAASAGVTNSGELLYAASREELKDSNISNIYSIVNFDNYDGILGIDSSGKVIIQESYYDFYGSDMRDEVLSWRSIKQLVYGKFQTFALLKDGRILCAYGNPERDYYYPVNSSVSSWRDIVEIGTNNYDLWGIDANGQLHYAAVTNNAKGSSFDISSFSSVKKVQFRNGWLIGLTLDGKVIASKDDNYDNAYPLPDEISNITQKVSDIMVDGNWLFVLQEDGTVIPAYFDKNDSQYDYSKYMNDVQKEISSWSGIIYIQQVAHGVIGVDIYGNTHYQSTSTKRTKSNDIYMYAVEQYSDIESKLESWKNIVYISSNVWERDEKESLNILGVHTDGTVSSLGTGKYLTLEKTATDNYYAKENFNGTYDVVDGWKLW